MFLSILSRSSISKLLENESFVSTFIAKRLAEDCHKFGTESTTADFPLAKAALELGTSQRSIEDKRDTMLEILNNQVTSFLYKKYHSDVTITFIIICIGM